MGWSSSPLPLPLPDPPLDDGVLALRPWQVADAPVLAAAWTDPEVVRWTGVPARRTEADARRWIEGERERRLRGMALDLVVTPAQGPLAGRAVGEVGLARLDAERRVAELGWWIAAGHRGRGLASRAVGLVAAWAVSELCIERVYARCHRRNPASSAVARAASLERAGTVDADVDLYVGPVAGGTLPT